MNTAEVIAALELPPATRVDQRITKKLLMEHGAPTAADRRLIQEGLDEVIWLAALKPDVLGVPAYRDAVRDYLEIAVIRLAPREGTRLSRLAELVHRAIPYPVLLVMDGPTPGLSLAHKRHSQAEADKVVLDGDLLGVDLHQAAPDAALLDALPVGRQPHASLFALYQGWMDAVEALQAARLTGTFRLPASTEQAQARRAALAEAIDLQARIQQLDKAARAASQLTRQVELNLALQQARQQLIAARVRL